MSVSRVRENRMHGSMRRREATNASRASTRRAAADASRRPYKDSLDAINVVFDDDRSVADAGVLVTATLARRLGIEALVNECVDLGRRVGYFRPGRKVMSLVHAMLLGADSVDDCDVLRSGRTGRVLGHRVMAPRRWGRSCGRSRSGMSVSLTGSSASC
jgi:hypothetical protein